MKLIALPAFSDNCIRMSHDGRQAVRVDSGDSAPVPAACAARHPTLAAILVILPHADPVGGNCALRPHLHAPKRDRIPPPFVARGQQPTRRRAGGLAAMKSDF